MAAAVTDGAELVRLLKKSGTPDHLLGPARAVLSAAHADKKRATAAAVVEALGVAHGPDHGTAAKAARIAATGEWEQDPADRVPIEDVILGPEETAPPAAAKPSAKPSPPPAAK